MNIDQERMAFEQAFPLPEGIVWSGKSYGPSFPNASPSVFVGLCGIAARQDALFSAWQARAALSPAEQPGRLVPDEWRNMLERVTTDLDALNCAFRDQIDEDMAEPENENELCDATDELIDEAHALLASAQPQGGEA